MDLWRGDFSILSFSTALTFDMSGKHRQADACLIDGRIRSSACLASQEHDGLPLLESV